MSFVHEDPEFGAILQIVAGDRGLSVALIEKDYWVAAIVRLSNPPLARRRDAPAKTDRVASRVDACRLHPQSGRTLANSPEGARNDCADVLGTPHLTRRCLRGTARVARGGIQLKRLLGRNRGSFHPTLAKSLPRLETRGVILRPLGSSWSSATEPGAIRASRMNRPHPA